MATTTVQFLAALLVCLVTLSIMATCSATNQDSESSKQALHDTQLSASSLTHILKRRSTELQAPPNYYASRLAGYLRSSPQKRDDGYWIWMPAHGYMSVPRDEMAANNGEKDSMGNLLRYGR